MYFCYLYDGFWKLLMLCYSDLIDIRGIVILVFWDFDIIESKMNWWWNMDKLFLDEKMAVVLWLLMLSWFWILMSLLARSFTLFLLNPKSFHAVILHVTTIVLLHFNGSLIYWLRFMFLALFVNCLGISCKCVLKVRFKKREEEEEDLS